MLYDLMALWARLEPDRCRVDEGGGWHIKRAGQWCLVGQRGEFLSTLSRDTILGAVLEYTRLRGWPADMLMRHDFIIVALEGRDDAPKEQDVTRAWLARYLESVARERLAARKEG